MPPDDASSAKSAQTPSFEEGLAQLAEIVNRLEGGGLGLTESIAAYERGVVVLRGLHEELATAEERIRVLTAVDDEGRPITEPFPGTHDGPPPDVVRKPASRAPAQRKAPRSPTLPGMDDSLGKA